MLREQKDRELYPACDSDDGLHVLEQAAMQHLDAEASVRTTHRRAMPRKIRGEVTLSRCFLSAKLDVFHLPYYFLVPPMATHAYRTKRQLTSAEPASLSQQPQALPLG